MTSEFNTSLLTLRGTVLNRTLSAEERTCHTLRVHRLCCNWKVCFGEKVEDKEEEEEEKEE